MIIFHCKVEGYVIHYAFTDNLQNESTLLQWPQFVHLADQLSVALMIYCWYPGQADQSSHNQMSRHLPK